jgi:hypothetical protein
VIGVFKTVAREVGEAEANLQPVKERHSVKAARMWVDLLSLLLTHPIQARKTRPVRRFRSPLWRMREMGEWQERGEMKMIQLYAVPS